MDNIVYNGIDSRDLGVKINRANPFAVPQRRVSSYIVPGRNGSVIVDDGCYDNVQLEYTFALYNTEKDVAAADAVTSWLCRDGEYHRLEDSRWPDVYRMARVADATIVQIGSVRRSIEATVTFDCLPERWLLSGETPIIMDLSGDDGAEQSVMNPTGHTAYPGILIPASQSVITIRIRQSSWYGYAQFTIAAHVGEIKIDTATGNSVFLSGPLQGNPAIGFVDYTRNGLDEFELRGGMSHLTATIETPAPQKILVYPRWWTI